MFGVITTLLFLGVLLNDFYQTVFGFQNGFLNWENDYTHGFGFYVVIACISASTVKYHVENLLAKTGFHTRTELASEVRSLGIVIKEKYSLIKTSQLAGRMESIVNIIGLELRK